MPIILNRNWPKKMKMVTEVIDDLVLGDYRYIGGRRLIEQSFPF
jgi:hypothetical protein